MRLAAGRARALGLPTRGTTAPNRLRRNDRWIAHVAAPALRASDDPLVVDLGYGASAVTTWELARAVRVLRPGTAVVGVENDRERVATALRDTARASGSDTDGITFVHGGFEVAGLRPTVVRAMNVLRQYGESAVAPAWSQLLAALAPGGLLVEGTCDELGRRGTWITLDAGGPRWFTLSTHLASLTAPSDLAPRLPKALIHRNVAGEPIHTFLADADAAWDRAAAQEAFGRRQRWIATCRQLRDRGWPVRDGVRRWRLGELTLAWESIAPAG